MLPSQTPDEPLDGMLRPMLVHTNTAGKDSPTFGDVSLDYRDVASAWLDDRAGLFADKCELVAGALVSV
jgi:hypothetical protein